MYGVLFICFLLYFKLSSSNGLSRNLYRFTVEIPTKVDRILVSLWKFRLFSSKLKIQNFLYGLLFMCFLFFFKWSSSDGLCRNLYRFTIGIPTKQDRILVPLWKFPFFLDKTYDTKNFLYGVLFIYFLFFLKWSSTNGSCKNLYRFTIGNRTKLDQILVALWIYRFFSSKLTNNFFNL